jgi:hypothetical protein
MTELGSQLVSETGKDILTIPLGETEPVLYRLRCSILLLDGIRTQPDLVPGHILYPGLILFACLVAGTSLIHTGITVLRCTFDPLALAILEFFLGQSFAGYLLLYMQVITCLVANALCLPLLPGCHDGCRSKDKNKHCAQCYLLEHSSHSWRVGDDKSLFTRFHQTISRDYQTFSRTGSYISSHVGERWE